MPRALLANVDSARRRDFKSSQKVNGVAPR